MNSQGLTKILEEGKYLTTSRLHAARLKGAVTKSFPPNSRALKTTVMVLTKAYLRYVQSACFGVVCSLKANVVFIRRRTSKESNQITLYAACPALESVVIWDARRGEKVSVRTWLTFYV